jgi:thiol-disulfide isomerase/thioredoxin
VQSNARKQTGEDAQQNAPHNLIGKITDIITGAGITYVEVDTGDDKAWASWCGTCRAEMGSLERLAKRYNGTMFIIIGISTDDYRDKAAAFIDQADLTFENYIDHQLLMENMLGAATIPLTVLVDADARISCSTRPTYYSLCINCSARFDFVHVLLLTFFD